MVQKLFHTLSRDEVFEAIKSRSTGLTTAEAVRRLSKYGYNELPKEKGVSVFSLFLRQIKSPLIYVLFIAVILEFVLGKFVDAGLILVAVILNTVIGLVQEFKAENAFRSLRAYQSFQAKVLRDDHVEVVDAKTLVLGDLVVIEAGDRLPADLRLVHASNLQLNEAILTGESTAVKKHEGVLEPGTILAERTNMSYMGTSIFSGYGQGVVVSIGLDTEIGKITDLLSSVHEDETPLQLRLRRLSSLLTIAVFVIGLVIFLEGLLRDFNPLEIFETSVAVGVAAIPEGLLVTIAIILAIGMQRMAKQNGLVRRMSAVETLGSTSVICSDKTGTLTKGEMTVVRIITGTNSQEEVHIDMTVPVHAPHMSDLLTALEIAGSCNNAMYRIINGGEKVLVGNPTDIALFHAAQVQNLTKLDLEDRFPRLDEIPFTSDQKYMATLHTYSERENVIFVKGAPEVVLLYSRKYQVDQRSHEMSDERRKHVLHNIGELAAKGFRVIAVAYKKMPGSFTDFTENNDVLDLIFVGLFVIEDPLRPETKQLLTETKNAGIRTILITGDHQRTAAHIGRQIGLGEREGSIVDGSQLDEWSDAELSKRIVEIEIYSRVLPHHKVRIVDAWQSRGEVVAMIGDGVNDAAALKAADIGVAVGSATDVAKGTADLILLDSNFKTLVSAIREGRVIFNNIRKVVLYLMVDSFSEVVLISGALILGLPLPLLPLQILYINLITDGLPSVSLAFEPGNKSVMEQPPRPKNEDVINRRMKYLIFLIGILTDLGLFAIFYYLFLTGMNIEHIRTILFMALALDSLLYVFSCKSLSKSLFQIKFWDNPILLAAVGISLMIQMAAMTFTPLREALHLTLLSGNEWLIIIMLSLIKIVLIEVGKLYFNLSKNKSVKTA